MIKQHLRARTLYKKLCNFVRFFEAVPAFSCKTVARYKRIINNKPEVKAFKEQRDERISEK